MFVSKATIEQRLLAEALASVDASRIHDLHIIQTGIVLQEHLDLFERGIARKLDFSYSEPQGASLARALSDGKIELGAIHTYLELFSRYFMDLTPHVALIAAVMTDGEGNLYTGPNTEDTPTIVEATAFKSGIVIAQVNEVVEKVRESTFRAALSTSSLRAIDRFMLSRFSRATLRRLTKANPRRAGDQGYICRVGISVNHASLRQQPRTNCCCRLTVNVSGSKARSPPTGH